MSNEIAKLLHQYVEYAYIQNIVEYFSYGKVKSIPDNSTEFTKGAFKLNQMILNGSTTDDINKYVVELKKIPLSYCEMRSFFG
jgi:hypothetical protein